jgi:hypothetical protein
MKKKDEEHFLLETRALASVGLLGVGGGIGLALMLARVLVIIGFAITALSALAVLWIYAKGLRSAYRTLTKRVPYRGPAIRELLLTNLAAVFLIGIAVAVCSIVLVQEPPTGRATLNLIGIQRVKIPVSSSSGFLNVEIKNQGALDAENVAMIVGGLVSPSLLTSDALKRYLSQASDAFDHANPAASKAQLRVGVSSVITPRDIGGPDTWTNKNVTGLTVSDSQWQDFEQAKLAIYVFYVLRFEDGSHRNSYWTTTNCAYWIGTTAFWHNCADNRVDLLSLR